MKSVHQRRQSRCWRARLQTGLLKEVLHYLLVLEDPMVCECALGQYGQSHAQVV